MSTPQSSSVVLRTAAVWGTTVLAVRDLQPGESLALGDEVDALLPAPDGIRLSPRPVRAAGAGWEVDAAGAIDGVVYLRGRMENPVDLSRSGAPVPIVAGDHGLLQYGSVSVFFQLVTPPPKIASKWRVDWVFVLSFLFALVCIVGGLTLIALLTTPRALDKPTELTSAEDLALEFHLEEPTPPIPGDKKSESGSGVKNPGAKDNKKSGGGKKAKGAEGALGRKADQDHTEQPGEIKQSLGGMSDVLSSDVGHEIQKTLGSISSVADALGGLGSDKVVLGRGAGLGLKGGGDGGGGDTAGVPFGAGTLETGWGPGRGGGFGAGAGGPGGRGRGGNGRGGGGTGEGSGEGTGEHKVAGSDKPAPGQGLTPAQISRVVQSRYGAFRACYEAASAREPNLSGGVTIAWSITPGGDVSSARVQSSTLGNPRVEGCIQRLFSRLRFPTADKGTNASWPFLFKPGKK
ncbi:MAG TPA: AgmX/PglI C-terminal domain-containing protein [Polyangiaceae bacterium]|nr:AgmX/PglI C-terminal domain-containing protein [Polyangiaceae bacterium]